MAEEEEEEDDTVAALFPIPLDKLSEASDGPTLTLLDPLLALDRLLVVAWGCCSCRAFVAPDPFFVSFPVDEDDVLRVVVVAREVTA